MRYYKQLSIKERRQIRAFLDMDWSVDDIAMRLKRHRSTIYRELKRNSMQAHYSPSRAHTKAYRRKQRRPFKLLVNSKCYKYVMQKLKLGWSPEQIAGRIHQLGLSFCVCHETIYQYVYKHAREHIFYYLPTQRSKRKRRRKRQSYSIYAVYIIGQTVFKNGKR